ncbi:MAG: rod shape-determining protein RodA [Candidatus Eremiobacterota bacterium]
MPRFDLPLVLSTLILTGLGLVAILSATGQDLGPQSEFRRQLLFAGLGLALMLIFALVDYEFWGRAHWALYALGSGLLVAVDLAGHTAMGAQRWLSLGPVSFQPSELAKLTVLVSLARVLGAPTDRERSQRIPWVAATLLVALPMLLIFLQPDLGTALVLVCLLLTLLYCSGCSPVWLGAVVLLGLLAAPLVLHDYQRERLLTFLEPGRDPTGSGWNLIQSQIAVGSGEIWGKGLFQGTQNQFNFVPEHHTDFIFTVIGEELGLVGGLAVLAFYGYILSSGLATAVVARDRFGSLLAVGIVAILGFHVLVNIGMVIGLMPVTGVPLPLLSYGGSSLWVTMMMLGLLLSIRQRQPKRRPLEDEADPFAHPE